jgi:hypothetical protein
MLPGRVTASNRGKVIGAVTSSFLLITLPHIFPHFIITPQALPGSI